MKTLRNNLSWAWENAKIFALPFKWHEYVMYPVNFVFGFVYHFAGCYKKEDKPVPNK